MKSNLLKNVLDWIIATGVLLSIIFFVQFYFHTKELRQTQIELTQIQQNRQRVNVLLLQTMEYNKANPDANLTRILDSVRAPAAAAAAAGAAAPGAAATSNATTR